MPEECRRTLVVVPPSSREATVSGSGGPKSTGKRSRDPANSTGVSLEGWRRYARFWPWPRGRHGRGRRRRGMSAMEVAQSMSMISGARRGSKALPPEQLLGEAARELNMLTPADRDVYIKRRRLAWLVVGDEWGFESAEGNVAVKRQKLVETGFIRHKEWGVGSAEGDAAVKRFLGQDESSVTKETSDIKSLETLKELGYPVSKTYNGSLEKPMSGKTDVEIAIDEPTLAEGFAVAKTGGEIASKESRPEEGSLENPMAGQTDDEIAIDEPTLAEGFAVTKTGGEIASKESRPEEGYLEKPMAGKTDAEIALAKRWLPLRYPAYPSTGKFDDFLKYTEHSKMIREHNKAGFDRTKNLPTWRVEYDDETKDPMKCEEKDVWLKAGKSVVAISSVGPGHDNTLYCSGVIISCDEEGIVRVLTSSGILYNDDDELHSLEQKVVVKLSNGRKYGGEILYVSKHYNLAILKVCVGSSMPTLGFGSMPRYGQRVIALGRDSMDLLIKDGFISTLERTALGRTHYMFPKSASGFPVICTGGPVIDEDGAMVGIITCHVPEPAMMSIYIVQICLDMWEKYGCIARPDLNMNLRTVKMLPPSEKDKVQCLYNIQKGFIIDGVEYDSTPEKVGIRKGDVVEIVDENCGFTLPELETFLLKHGLRFLPKVEGLSSMQELELKIRVHDLVEGSSTSARLSIPVVFEVALP